MIKGVVVLIVDQLHVNFMMTSSSKVLVPVASKMYHVNQTGLSGVSGVSGLSGVTAKFNNMTQIANETPKKTAAAKQF